MNTKILPVILILMLSQYIYIVRAQSTYQLGGLPSFNINSKLKNDWSLNFKTESRQHIQSGDFHGETDRQYKYLLTDVSLIAAKKVGLNSRVAGGYLIRLEEGELYHRFILQYNIVQKLQGFRLAHRLLSDLTVSETEKSEIRVRYRISSEIPLNGISVDEGEFYVKINNEYVNSLQAGEYDLEIRLVPLLGYDISESFKIETGLDYRVSSFLDNKTRNRLWLSVNLFVEI